MILRITLRDRLCSRDFVSYFSYEVQSSFPWVVWISYTSHHSHCFLAFNDMKSQSDGVRSLKFQFSEITVVSTHRTLG